MPQRLDLDGRGFEQPQRPRVAALPLQHHDHADVGGGSRPKADRACGHHLRRGKHRRRRPCWWRRGGWRDGRCARRPGEGAGAGHDDEPRGQRVCGARAQCWVFAHGCHTRAARARRWVRAQGAPGGQHRVQGVRASWRQRTASTPTPRLSAGWLCRPEGGAPRCRRGSARRLQAPGPPPAPPSQGRLWRRAWCGRARKRNPAGVGSTCHTVRTHPDPRRATCIPPPPMNFNTTVQPSEPRKQCPAPAAGRRPQPAAAGRTRTRRRARVNEGRCACPRVQQAVSQNVPRGATGRVRVSECVCAASAPGVHGCCAAVGPRAPAAPCGRPTPAPPVAAARLGELPAIPLRAGLIGAGRRSPQKGELSPGGATIAHAHLHGACGKGTGRGELPAARALRVALRGREPAGEGQCLQCAKESGRGRRG